MPEKHPLQAKYPDLQKSAPVELSVEQHRRRGERIPNEPSAKLEAWLGDLERIYTGRGASPERQEAQPQVIERIKKIYHRDEITGTDDASVMRKIEMDAQKVEDEGGGLKEDIMRRVNPQLIDKYREQIHSDQANSLDKWIDYLTSEGANYPMWFKYYVFHNITNLTDQIINNKFQDRSRKSFNKFPPIKYEALALVFEAMANHYGLSRLEKEADNTKLDSETKEHLRGDANFAKLYKKAIDVVDSRSKEILNTTDGQWVKYDMVDRYNDDYEEDDVSEQAYDLTAGTAGTGWCVGGSEGTAEGYLRGGDFYVYYTKDSNGEYTSPRLAISMNGSGHNAKFTSEIRGVEGGAAGDQGVEPEFLDILRAKMDEINPEDAKEYDKKIENMKRVTEIYARKGEELSKEDLIFLYEIEDDIVSFAQEGYDPRVDELLNNRDFMGDVEIIYEKSNQAEIVDAMLEHGDYYFLANNIDFFDELDQNLIAQQLIDNGQVEAVANNLDKFQGLDNTTAQKLIATGRGRAVARNLDKFQDLDNTTAQKLIEAGGGEAVAYNLYKFPDLDNTTAQQLIDNGEGWAVADDLNKFQGLDHNQIAQQLIAKGEGEAVAYNLDKFQGLDHNQIAQQLIDNDYGEAVAYNLDKFQGLDHNQIAQQLIDNGQGRAVAKNLNNFQDLDHNQIAQKLIDAGGGRAVAEYLYNFQVLDNTTAQQLIDNGQVEAVANNLDKFQGLDNTTAQQLIDNGEGWTVAYNLDKFQGLDHNQIAQQLIDNGQGRTVAKNLNNFQDLDHNQIAQKLIDAGGGRAVAEYLYNFQGLNNTTAQQLIDNGEGWTVARNPNNFQGLDNTTAQKLIATGRGRAVARNPNNFQGLDNTTAQKLIATGRGWAVADNLDKFQGLDHNQIAQQLIYNGQVQAVADNLDKFQGLDHNQIAQKLIDAGGGRAVAEYLYNFQGLSAETMKRLKPYLKK